MARVGSLLRVKPQARRPGGVETLKIQAFLQYKVTRGTETLLPFGIRHAPTMPLTVSLHGIVSRSYNAELRRAPDARHSN